MEHTHLDIAPKDNRRRNRDIDKIELCERMALAMQQLSTLLVVISQQDILPKILFTDLNNTFIQYSSALLALSYLILQRKLCPSCPVAVPQFFEQNAISS